MRPLLTMRWEHLLFLHWPVDPDRVGETLPEGLSVATHDGRAWLGVVAFTMPDIRPRGSPYGLSFHEVNLRTYVRPESGGPKGVYFYNLDANDWLGVLGARAAFRLPYYHAEMRLSRVDADTTGGSVDHDPTFRFLSRRRHPGADPARVDLVFRPTGDPAPGEPGSLDEFLAENYRFYTGSRPWYCEIRHDPWPLQSAAVTVRENGLFEANGFEPPEGDPLVHYTAALDVRAGRLRRVDD
ncbi:YqjF family protein [Halobium salinum]|uniref:YqjF family protein n=1 Tax=Halobium salinum TaxID=1364940 RepID=A0ABD5P7W3_9EURY|nr:DUF2071 domain-containing protein [Halobium salinum]